MFANDEAEVFNRPVVVIIQDSQVPFCRLYGTRKIKFESKSDEDVRLQMHQALLADGPLLDFSEVVDHPLEVR